MYKRPRAEAKPKKKKDEHNRKRDIIVNFRMSPEERAELEQRILMSGKKKQDYMIQSSLEQKLEIVANRKMLMNIQERMDIIEIELKRVANADALDIDKLAGLKALIELFQAVKE